MQSITLQKIPGERYDERSYKTYEAYRNGQHVGYVAQTLCYDWEVADRYMVPVSRHTTIKAAARVARKVL